MAPDLNPLKRHLSKVSRHQPSPLHIVYLHRYLPQAAFYLLSCLLGLEQGLRVLKPNLINVNVVWFVWPTLLPHLKSCSNKFFQRGKMEVSLYSCNALGLHHYIEVWSLRRTILAISSAPCLSCRQSVGVFAKAFLPILVNHLWLPILGSWCWDLVKRCFWYVTRDRHEKCCSEFQKPWAIAQCSKLGRKQKIYV